jgi:hypothetical protein
MNADTDRRTTAVLVARSRSQRLVEAARSTFLAMLTVRSIVDERSGVPGVPEVPEVPF